MEEEGHKVALNVYDLSQGLACQLSTTFLGRAIEGIWHTGVVVYGNEYYFGGGVQHSLAGKTPYGTPIKVVDLGVTHVPKDVFEINEVTQFLVGGTIPDYILNLPSEVMSSPMGAVILPIIQQLETTMRSGAVPQAPQFWPTTQVQTSKPTATVKKTVAGSDYVSTTREVKSEEQSAKVTDPKTNRIVPPITPASGSQDKSSVDRVGVDPLGDARGKVQEEITKEFAAIMATGMLRASEAAALATRRVMQRYGHTNVAQS